MDCLFLYIFIMVCVCGIFSIFLYVLLLYDLRELLNIEEVIDCIYWRWYGYIRFWWDLLIIINNFNNVREVWLIIFVLDSFMMRWLNCIWCKKWCWVGGCLDMLGGGLVDILFLFVYNLCLLFLLENLEKNDMWFFILNMNKFYFVIGLCLYFINECIYCGSYICK